MMHFPVQQVILNFNAHSTTQVGQTTTYSPLNLILGETLIHMYCTCTVYKCHSMYRLFTTCHNNQDFLTCARSQYRTVHANSYFGMCHTHTCIYTLDTHTMRQELSVG